VRWDEVPLTAWRLCKQAELARQALPSDCCAPVFWHPVYGHCSACWPSLSGWLLIKQADGLPTGNLFATQPGALTAAPGPRDGHSPLTLALASGLIGGGLGYGAGVALEHILPERFVQRGKLRRTLGLAGALPGPLFSAWMASAAKRIPLENGQPRGWFQAITDHPWPGGEAKTGSETDIWEELHIKLADQLTPSGALYLPTIPVDAFNNAIWNDVRPGQTAAGNPYGTKDPFGTDEQQLHTPPPIAAAVSGLITGIARQQGTSLLSPVQIISALANAGVGLGTAAVTGKILGALGGLNPQTQQSLQRMGAWAGLLQTAVSPVFSR
jgi:hypothetical protein